MLRRNRTNTHTRLSAFDSDLRTHALIFRGAAIFIALVFVLVIAGIIHTLAQPGGYARAQCAQAFNPHECMEILNGKD